MWLNLRWRSRAEDRLDAWITRQHQERVLAGRMIPVGPCPDEASLKSIAKHSKDISLSDPRVNHAANCPACMKRVLELRLVYRSRRRRLMFTAAAGCCLIVVSIVVVAIRRANTPHHSSDMAAIPEIIDLWNAGTNRGDQPTRLQPVSLPAALVKVTIILPRYSEPGRYMVAVTRDQKGIDLVARGSAASTGEVNREEVSVDIDLRNLQRGDYFLLTTHEQNQASYYYPLQIK
ncbi:MAG: hypothetical protein ABSF70_14300 [Terracidiphilus sp.]